MTVHKTVFVCDACEKSNPPNSSNLPVDWKRVKIEIEGGRVFHADACRACLSVFGDRYTNHTDNTAHGFFKRMVVNLKKRYQK